MTALSGTSFNYAMETACTHRLSLFYIYTSVFEN